MKTKTLQSRNSIRCASCRIAFLLIPLTLTCFALSPHGRAVCQQGCDLNDNTFLGDDALVNNTTGGGNTAVGDGALYNNTGNGNIALGNGAGTNLSTGSNNNIDIGNAGLFGDSNAIRIGKTGRHLRTFVAGVAGATVPTGVAVIVDSIGHLGTTTSSARFKEAIKPMDNASEAILALRPVTFRYKKELDPDGIPQFGLVAQEVAKVDPALVARDEQGKPY